MGTLVHFFAIPAELARTPHTYAGLARRCELLGETSLWLIDRHVELERAFGAGLTLGQGTFSRSRTLQIAAAMEHVPESVRALVEGDRELAAVLDGYRTAALAAVANGGVLAVRHAGDYEDETLRERAEAAAVALLRGVPYGNAATELLDALAGKHLVRGPDVPTGALRRAIAELIAGDDNTPAAMYALLARHPDVESFERRDAVYAELLQDALYDGPDG